MKNNKGLKKGESYNITFHRGKISQVMYNNKKVKFILSEDGGILLISPLKFEPKAKSTFIIDIGVEDS